MNDAGDPGDGAGCVDDVLITPQLSLRPSRAPDHAGESRALAALAQEMAANPGGVLQKCAELVMELCQADSAGISVLEPGGMQGILRWHAASGALAADLGGTMPREASPCGTAITRNGVLLFKEAERFFPALRDVEPRIYENLLAPWHANGEAMGALWAIKHSPEGRFDAEDARLLTSLARFAAAAYQMTAALAEAKAGREALERRATERALADTALRTSEERLQALVNATSSVIYRMSPDWAEMRQLDERGFLSGTEGSSRSWPGAYIHPDDQQQVRAAIQTAIRTKSVFELEHRVRQADGSPGWTLSRAVPLLDAGGEIREWFGAASDMTARKRAEEALRESEARFRHMADSAPALIWMTDADGQVVFANMHFDHMFGRPAAEMLGDGWARFVLDEDLEAFNAAFLVAVRVRQPFKAEARVHDRTGQLRWLRCEGVPRLDDAGRFLGYTGCGVDITEARLAAEELERQVAERTAELMAAEENLRQAQKMEAVGQLTGGIAHDFNNMLQGIAGGLDMAQHRIARGRAAEATRHLEAARSALERAAGLTRRLLAFARRQHLDPKPLPPSGLVAGMADLIRRTMGPGIRVELKLHNGTGSVLCDANELESALLNLCINARDAMPEGGRLTIATEEVRLSAAEISDQDGLSAGDYVAILVADTGMGMPPEVLQRVFEPFFTTKPLGQGTGLGLSQVYGFVRQSGGLVRLDSVPGQGTNVHLFLPRHEGAEAAPPAPEAPSVPEWAAGGATVLLVDDEEAVRGTAAERLRELGYRVLEVADGPAALDLLDGGAQADLLITDVGLPGGMNGRQVAEAVRERVPGLPVMFITGYAGTALPPGAEVIGKPFELDTLARRAQALLTAGRSGRSGEAAHTRREPPGSPAGTARG
ncbi:PAS domain S-box protein [Roseomonas sp. E05]|uniref:PAS domain S-box protein n=1 Tax=Roseomonas sp. E05 TaxID=3046310 RepID=UPI0024BA515B|nr:PAS domain S-box protein [Roseomonas sp. E05]MDJ0391626.1 PAS domain S-box protein [Roseomonas sp. E05]